MEKKLEMNLDEAGTDELEAFEERLEQVLKYLQREFKGYPYDCTKDPMYFRRLYSDFPRLDIEDELKQYHAWILDQPAEKRIYYRSRFRTWLKSAVRYQSGFKTVF